MNLVSVSVNCIANMFGGHTKQSRQLTHRRLGWAHIVLNFPVPSRSLSIYLTLFWSLSLHLSSRKQNSPLHLHPAGSKHGYSRRRSMKGKTGGATSLRRGSPPLKTQKWVRHLFFWPVTSQFLSHRKNVTFIKYFYYDTNLVSPSANYSNCHGNRKGREVSSPSFSIHNPRMSSKYRGTQDIPRPAQALFQASLSHSPTRLSTVPFKCCVLPCLLRMCSDSRSLSPVS